MTDTSSIAVLRRLLDEVPRRLGKLAGTADTRAEAGKWSPKEELGHLLDSAANNHQRIVRSQLQDRPVLPGYEQERWVQWHAYQRREWRELVELWLALNRQLLAAAEAIPDSGWARTCSVADSDQLTVQFIFDDYLRHMLHHLEHIGVRIDDLRS